MNDDLPPLPAEASALLDAGRAAVRPSDDARAAILARVLRTVALPPPPGGGSAAPAPASIGPLLAKALRVACIAAAVGAAGVAWRGARPPTPAAVAPAPPSRPHSPPVVVPPPAPAVVPSDASVPSPTPADAASEPAPSHAEERNDRNLHAQIALLDEARTALALRDPSAVLGAVRRYRHLRRRRLDDEFDVFEVRALLQQGDREGAERATERFHRRRPDSVFAAAIDDAMRSAP